MASSSVAHRTCDEGVGLERQCADAGGQVMALGTTLDDERALGQLEQQQVGHIALLRLLLICDHNLAGALMETDQQQMAL